MMDRSSVAPRCHFCTARYRCFFPAEIEGNSLSEFMNCRKARKYKKGHMIFYEGDPPLNVFIVCGGAVKVFRSDRKGRQFSIDIAVPGDMIGYVALLYGGPFAMTAEALQDSVICSLHAKDFRWLLATKPVFAEKIMRALAESVRRLSLLAGEMTMEPGRQRMLNMMYELAQKCGHQTDSGVALGVRFTRRELGNLVGLTQETVIRVLRRLESDGLVSLRGKNLYIKDMARLSELISNRRNDSN